MCVGQGQGHTHDDDVEDVPKLLTHFGLESARQNVCPAGWLPLSDRAGFLGVCQQTFLLQNFIFAKYEKEEQEKYIKSHRPAILLASVFVGVSSDGWHKI